MVAFNIVNDTNMDDASLGFAAGDTANVRQGATFTISSDPMQFTGEGLATINGEGGRTLVDGRDTKRVAYTTTAGALSYGDIVTGGTSTESGKVIRVTPTEITFQSLTGPLQAGEPLSSNAGWTGTATAASQVGGLEIHYTAFNSLEPGMFECRGEWYELGVGDGTAGQSFEYFSDQACPGLEVETGAGTGVYDPWNFTRNFTHLSTLKAGEAFTQADGSMTLVIGDGVNGNVIPAGARVRCQNVLFIRVETDRVTKFSRDSATITSFDHPHITMDKVAFSSIIQFLGFSGGASFNVLDSAFFKQIRFSNCLANMSFSRCSVSGHSTAANSVNTIFTTGARNSIFFTDSSILNGNCRVSYPINIGSDAIIFLRCKLIFAMEVQALHNATINNTTPPGRISIDDCDVVGRFLCRTYSDDGSKSLVTNSRWGLSPFDDITVVNYDMIQISNTTVENITSFPGAVGNGNNTTVLINVVSGNNTNVKNIGTKQLPINFGTIGGIIQAQRSNNVNVFNVHVAGMVLNSAVIRATSYVDDVRLYNVSSDNNISLNITNNKSIHYRSITGFTQDIGSLSSFYNLTTEYGEVFSTTFPPVSISTTVGMVRIQPLYTISGQITGSLGIDSYRFRDGKVTIPPGASLTFDSLENLLGFTGFDAGTPIETRQVTTVVGASANLTYEYDINVAGGGFSTVFNTMTAAALATHAIDSANGFQLRVRVTNPTAADIDLSSISITMLTTLVDSEALYPDPTDALAVVAPVLQNIGFDVLNTETHQVGLVNNSTMGSSPIDFTQTTLTPGTPNVKMVANPGEGTFTVRDGGSVIFAPVAGYVGSSSTQMQIQDSQSNLSNIATITANVIQPPGAPVLSDSVGTTPNTTALPLDLTIQITDGSFPTDLTTLDLDPATAGRQTTFANAGEGSFTVDNAGQLTFTPDAAFTGTTTLLWVVSNSIGQVSNQGQLQIGVTAPGQPRVSDRSGSASFNTPVVIDLTTGFVAGGAAIDAATVDLDPASAGTEEKTLNNAGEGVFTVDGAAQLTFTPDATFSGTSTVTYTIKDTLGLVSNTGSIGVTIASPAPPVAGVFQDTALNTTTPTLDLLTIISAGDLAIDPASVDLNTGMAGQQTTFTAPGGGFTVDAAGELTFTPVVGFTGSAVVSFTIDDTAGNTSNIGTVTFVMTNPAAPTATNQTVSTVQDTATASLNLPAAVVPGGLAVSAASVDIDPSSPGTEDKSFTVAGAGVFNVDGAGNVIFTPDAGYTGNASATYTIKDTGSNISNVGTISVTVVAPGGGGAAVNTPGQWYVGPIDFL